MSKNIKIVLASQNKNKLNEIQLILQKFNITNVSFSLASDYTNFEPEENGTTYEENAYIKAKAISAITNSICLSDDSGFSVEAIDNQPGVHTARWCVGNDTKPAFEKIQKLMGNSKNTKAFFTTVLCLYIPTDLQEFVITPKSFHNNHAFFTGIINGNISFPPRGTNGFSYDTIFIPHGYNKTYAEMESEEKNSLSNRYKAIMNFKNNFLDLNIN